MDSFEHIHNRQFGSLGMAFAATYTQDSVLTPNFIITPLFAPVSNMFYDIFSPRCYGFPSTIDFKAMKLDFPPIFNRLL